MSRADVSGSEGAAPSVLCRCDGRYDGCEHGRLCSVTAAATHSHLFCQLCDDRRRAHITSRLVEFRDALA